MALHIARIQSPHSTCPLALRWSFAIEANGNRWHPRSLGRTGSAKRAGGFCKLISWFLPVRFLRKPALPDTKRLVSA
ncbi:MAG: hypothetical protein A2Z30_01515 [Chloroflexi bacterium RBG_16_64_43]|nr:MAG: hypothetical protein A2Z30_01515 [Chloroflexi bacterium RBG_16_64_43]